jgi:phage FluMu gp28-like protein
VTWTKRAKFLIQNLDLPSASGVPGAKWEHFQLAHLNDNGILRCEAKSRQIAASFTFSAEAVANALLDSISSLFQSINLDEAREKILYARSIYESIYMRGMPKITQPNTTTQLGFSNGARIISSPGTPQRGKARFWVYLDEWAHQTHDRANYTAAFPVVSKGGKLRGASSPMGAGGFFWEIFKEELRQYPGYTRKSTPWWQCKSFIAFDMDIYDAYINCPLMTSQDRVEKYGNERIKLIFENMPSDDFQQEYELAFQDEVSAWISWSLIQSNQQDDLLCYHITSHEDIDKLIKDVGEAIEADLIEPVLYGGLDIGRVKDLTEFIGIGKSSTGQLPIRIMVSLANCPYEYQEHAIYRLLTELPFVSCLIDQNGIGNQLAETLSGSTVAQGVSFTNSSKELWAVETKLQMEKNNVPLPKNRDLAYQIHSIKKSVTAAKNNVFDTERNTKHHADKFWALALALWAARSLLEPASEKVEAPMSIYKTQERERLWQR